MSYSDYLRFLQSLSKTLDDLTLIQQDKLAAGRANDLEAINQCMKREQACSMTLRGLERKRETLTSQLSLPAVPLSKLPPHVPQEHRSETFRLVERILQQYKVLRSAQTAAQTVLEGNLRHVEQRLREKGIELDENGSYQSLGAFLERPSFTDFKV